MLTWLPSAWCAGPSGKPEGGGKGFLPALHQSQGTAPNTLLELSYFLSHRHLPRGGQSEEEGA